MDAEKKPEKVQEKDAAEEKGLTKKKYTFTIDYKGCGRSYKGASFTNKILNSNGKMDRDILEATYRAGQSFDSFNPDAILRQQVMAHLVTSLVDRPDWAKNLGEIEDLNLLLIIYKEVKLHEETFLGSGQD